MVPLLFALFSEAGAGSSIGNVALMTFSMEMPYGLVEVQGRKPDGSIVMTREGALPWFRAGFGRRPKIDPDPTAPGKMPAWSGFQVQRQAATLVQGRNAVITVGSGKLSDGTAIVVFDAVVADKGIPPFVVEAIVPGDNATAWVTELERSLASVELFTE